MVGCCSKGNINAERGLPGPESALCAKLNPASRHELISLSFSRFPSALAVRMISMTLHSKSGAHLENRKIQLIKCFALVMNRVALVREGFFSSSSFFCVCLLAGRTIILTSMKSRENCQRVTFTEY